MIQRSAEIRDGAPAVTAARLTQWARAKKLLFNVNVAWFFLSHRLAIGQAARDHGFEVHVAGDIETQEEVQAIESAGMVFHRLSLSRGGLNPSRDLSYCWQLRKLVRHIRPDVMHNITVKPIVYGSIVGRLLRVPHIVNAVSGLGYAFSINEGRRLISRLVNSAYRIALSRKDIRVIFQNSDDVDLFTRGHLIGPDQAVLIRGSGVDLNRFVPISEPTATPRVVLPARLLRDKGVMEFAAAAKLLREENIKARFELAGKLDERNRAGLSRTELEQLKLDTGIEWLGHIDDVSKLYQNVNIVCLPSYREGIPKALLEACAAGRPIIATDVPGCREVVANGVNGLLVAPRDVAGLAGALRTLLNDADLRAKMGRAGRLRAEQEFDVANVVKATLNVYRELLDQGHFA